MENKNNSGAIFKNTNKKADNHPDYKGQVMVNGKQMDIALWLKTSQSGTPYFSASFTEPYKAPDKTESAPIVTNDDLPF